MFKTYRIEWEFKYPAWDDHPRTFTVSARTHAEALRNARRVLANAGHGGTTAPYKARARLMTDEEVQRMREAARPLWAD